MALVETKVITLPPSRWKEYRDLRLEALHTENFAFGADYTEEVVHPASAWKKNLKEKKIVFAEVDGKLVGMMSYYFNPKKRVKHLGEIFAVFVKKEFRGKGVAQAMLDFVFAQARKSGIKKIRLEPYADNARSIGFYKKNGFRKIATLKAEFNVGGKFYDSILMEKFL